MTQLRDRWSDPPPEPLRCYSPWEYHWMWRVILVAWTAVNTVALVWLLLTEEPASKSKYVWAVLTVAVMVMVWRWARSPSQLFRR